MGDGREAVVNRSVLRADEAKQKSAQANVSRARFCFIIPVEFSATVCPLVLPVMRLPDGRCFDLNPKQLLVHCVSLALATCWAAAMQTILKCHCS